MADLFTRGPENPITTPGRFPWRMSNVLNPDVPDEDGIFCLHERIAEDLRPFHCYIGLLQSDDGVYFTQVENEPV